MRAKRILSLALIIAFVTPVAFAAEDGPSAAAAAKPGWGHRILWYLPNRVLDLVDVFRLRARVGPGLAINVRMTDNANFFAGRYKTAFVGLPGPRRQPALRKPFGLEQERGLLVMGVDATDDLPDNPRYSASEFDLGAQVFIVGAEAGFDPVEMGDFFAGFILLDPMRDDH